MMINFLPNKLKNVIMKMTSNTTIKFDEAIANTQKFIEQMEQMDDKKLSKHLDLFRHQMEKAYQQNNDAAYNLLYEYEQQTLIARINKNFVIKK